MMKNGMKLEIVINDYNDGRKSYVKDFTKNDLFKFSGLIELMKNNINHTQWNWFSSLPTKWDGNKYVLDIWKLEHDFKEKWGFSYADVCTDESFGPTNFIKEFFLRFTPNGADSITGIHLYEIKEI